MAEATEATEASKPSPAQEGDCAAPPAKARRPYRSKPAFSPPGPAQAQASPSSPEEQAVQAALAKRRAAKPKPPRAGQIQYRPSVHPLAASYLKRAGATSQEVAEALGASQKTLARWASVHPAFGQAMKVSPLAACESVTRALLKAALGQEVVDVEELFEVRANPVTRERERVLVRERRTTRRSLPNPLACFFYLQNRDSARWNAQGRANAQGSPFRPEQVADMMRAAGQAVLSATLGEPLPLPDAQSGGQ